MNSTAVYVLKAAPERFEPETSREKVILALVKEQVCFKPASFASFIHSKSILPN